MDGIVFTGKKGRRLKLVEIPPFTSADWAAEYAAYQARRMLPRCPNCERSENYAPYIVKHADGSERRYRGCKSCGCWQNADGTPAYRCSALVHSCERPIADGVM